MGTIHSSHAAYPGAVLQLLSTAEEDTGSARNSRVDICW